jgi:hypothetical protein
MRLIVRDGHQDVDEGGRNGITLSTRSAASSNGFSVSYIGP